MESKLEVYDQDGEYNEHGLPSFVCGKKADAEFQKRAAMQELRETCSSTMNKTHSKFWQNTPESAMLAKLISAKLGSLKNGTFIPTMFPAAVGRLGAEDGWTIGAKMSSLNASQAPEDCEMVEEMLRHANKNEQHPDHYSKAGDKNKKQKVKGAIGSVDHGDKVKTYNFPLKLPHDDRRILRVVGMQSKKAYNAWVRAWSLTHRCSHSTTEEVLKVIIGDCWMHGVCVCY